MKRGNPLRWDCETRGCFNLLARPKIEVFHDCFPRGINFGDVDGLVEVGGKFCMLEWKSPGGTVGVGQARSHAAFTRTPGNIVFVVEGDAETMAISRYSVVWNGRRRTAQEATLDELKGRIRKWCAWADSGPI